MFEHLCRVSPAGAFLASTKLISDSAARGTVLLDAAPYEFSACSGGNAIAAGAPAHWRRRAAALGGGAFRGLTAIVCGRLEAPSAEALVRIIEAGGGTAVRRAAAPYHRGVQCESGTAVVAIISAHLPADDAGVRGLLAAGVPCVASLYILEWLSNPGADLAAYRLHGEAGASLMAHEEARGALSSPASAT